MSKQHPEPGEYFKPEPGETPAQARARAEAARKAPQNVRGTDPTTDRSGQPRESLAQALARHGGRGSQQVGRDLGARRQDRAETQEEAHARRNRTPEQQRAWEAQSGTPQGPRHGETPEQFNARRDAERRL